MKKKFVINTYCGVSASMEAYYAAKDYAEKIGATFINSPREIPKGIDAEIIRVDGLSLYFK